MGYKVVYYSKNDGTGEGELVAFKKCNFELVSSECVNLNNVSTDKDFQRNNIGVIALIRNRLNGFTLCVVNTHFYYLQQREDVRLCQCCYLLNRVPYP